MLKHRFEKLGRVIEVFIPAIKDKLGNNFGFVRFSGKGMEMELFHRLNNVWIGTYIIRAFLLRYSRDVKVTEDSRHRVRGPWPQLARPLLIKDPSATEKNVSYADILEGRKHKGDKGGKENGAGTSEEEVLVFASEDNENSWLRGAFTGVLKDEFSWREHGKELVR